MAFVYSPFVCLVVANESARLLQVSLRLKSAEGLRVSGWLTKSASADFSSRWLTKSKSFSEPLTGIVREICGHIFINDR